MYFFNLGVNGSVNFAVWATCGVMLSQVQVDWDKVNAKIDMELQKEISWPGSS